MNFTLLDEQKKKSVITLCRGIMSCSFSFSPVSGWHPSFLMIFSTHSIVTTSPLKHVCGEFRFLELLKP
jgi:hypothetical protein